MRIIDEYKLDFDDVLLVPKRSRSISRLEIDITRKYQFKNIEFEGIPIIASNMSSVGTIKTAKILKQYKMMTCLHKFLNLKTKDYNPYIIPTSNILLTLPPGYSYLCLDVANGYSEKFSEYVKNVKKSNPSVVIIAGNVVTPEMTEQLILSGADIVKVGLGSGAACTTRLMTGVGYPQLSAVVECSDAAHGLGKYIISDGGCRNPADIVKAFAAGADFVMVGTMFAGHKDNSNILTDKKTKKQYVEHFGMSSEKAQRRFYGEKKEYRASEGRSIKLPVKGSLKDTIENILGGIRSACTYVGAERLKDLSKCATFIKVSKQYNNSIETFSKDASNE